MGRVESGETTGHGIEDRSEHEYCKEKKQGFVMEVRFDN
jgi:hypothetical protein